MANGPNIRTVGSSARPATAMGAHNFERDYYKHAGTGDVRGVYADLKFTSTGGGEVIRARGIATAAGSAAAATINAAHFTGRLDSETATMSGALNAVRATLEVAGTTPTPGGTLAALNLDSNIVTGATLSANDAYIKVTDSGATALPVLFNFTTAEGTKSASTLVSTYNTATQVGTHGIKCRHNGADIYILATHTAPTT
jgi:hypothetical protein